MIGIGALTIIKALYGREAGLDRSELTERVGKLSKARQELVLSGVDVVLGR